MLSPWDERQSKNLRFNQLDLDFFSNPKPKCIFYKSNTFKTVIQFLGKETLEKKKNACSLVVINLIPSQLHKEGGQREW